MATTLIGRRLIFPFPFSSFCGGGGLFSTCRNASSTISQKCNQIIPELAASLDSPEFVQSSDAIRQQYGRDEGHFPAVLPDLVVRPSSTGQVAAIVRLANAHSIPIIPYGTGTGLEGGIHAIHGGICVDLRRMDQILALNEEDFDCTVQPGVTREALNRRLKDTGLWFTVDPGADASICGMVATGASGTTSIRYGTMKGNVRNLEVVLANGDILDTRGRGRRPWKSSAGYNLTELFIGSEGTLGIITAATVCLNARPPAFGVAICGFPSSSLRDAIQTVLTIRQMAIPVARLEFLDDRQMSSCLAANPEIGDIARPMHTICMEFHGGTREEVQRQTQLVEEICHQNGAQNFHASQEADGIQRLWLARHRAYYATLAMRPGARGFITDICVPISKLPSVLEQSRQLMDKMEIFGTIVGHVGEGNFHCILPVFEEDNVRMATVWTFSAQIVKLALSVGGTCTGEHGIGMGKMEYLKEEMGPIGWELMRRLKNQLDPKGIMNPGKIFPII